MDKSKLLKIIAEYTSFDADGLNEDMHFENDLGIDSLDLAQIIMALEDEYEIELEEEVLENIKTVGDALTVLQSSLE